MFVLITFRFEFFHSTFLFHKYVTLGRHGGRSLRYLEAQLIRISHIINVKPIITIDTISIVKLL